jgi:hypothetical protein
MVVPGDGYREVEITDNMTVAQFVVKNELQNRSITIDGEEIDPSGFNTHLMGGASEVWANGGAKGA